MEAYREFLVTPEVSLRDPGSPPESPIGEQADRKLEITVLFTSLKPTAVAARRAAGLLRGLDGRITLIDAQPIPYALPLDCPPVSLDFSKRRLLAMVKQSTVEMAAQVLLCRLRFETLLRVLKPGSLVVVGCRERWWPTWERKLARKLQRAGYQTVLIESR